jgi:hypothetical protein
VHTESRNRSMRESELKQNSALHLPRSISFGLYLHLHQYAISKMGLHAHFVFPLSVLSVDLMEIPRLGVKTVPKESKSFAIAGFRCCSPEHQRKVDRQ